MVIAVDLSDKMKAVARSTDMIDPWLVLCREQLWLADLGRGDRIMDVTPFPPWDERCAHNAELIEDLRTHGCA